jgi:hypothetical protein
MKMEKATNIFWPKSAVHPLDEYWPSRQNNNKKKIINQVLSVDLLIMFISVSVRV